jgi:hypothetical protein
MTAHVQKFNELEKVTQSHESFFHFIGLFDISQNFETYNQQSGEQLLSKFDSFSRNQRFVIDHFTAFLHYLKRCVELKKCDETAELWKKYIFHLTPISFRIIGYVHQLWVPSTWTVFHPSLKQITRLTNQEIGQTLSMGYQEEVGGTKSPFQTHLDSLWKWLARTSCQLRRSFQYFMNCQLQIWY